MACAGLDHTKAAVIKEQDRYLPSQAPSPGSCPLWQSHAASMQSYGPIFAFPATQLQTACPQTVDAAMHYTCRNVQDGQAMISDFWSTNTLDNITGQSVAKLMLGVSLQDDLGQNVVAGQICTPLNA